MKFYFFIITLFWFLAQTRAEATGGGLVGNGGDTVVCRKDPSNTFEGYYSLDYLLTYQHFNNNSDIVPVTTWAVSQKRILKILRADSELSYSFSDFSKRMLNHTDIKSRIWKEAAFGLVDLRDEQIVRQLPVNCRDKKPGNQGGIEIIQTVIRQRRPDLIVYEYDPQILRDLSLRTPLQYSFLMIHEWLWDYTDDVRVLRDVNRYLHSKAAETRNPNDVRTDLVRLGLDLNATNFKPICDRPTPIREAIERTYGSPCNSINQSFLDQLPKASENYKHCLRLETDHADLVSIAHDDLAHLRNICTVKITNSSLEYVSPAAFASLDIDGILTSVDVSGNKLTKLDPRFFDALGKVMGLLDFSNNRIQEIPEWVCKFIPPEGYGSDYYADFRNNPLSDRSKEILMQCKSTGKNVFF